MHLRFLTAALIASAALAQSVAPALRGETLDGRKITLAEAAAGKTTLLVLGFSKRAGDVSHAWRDRFAADFGSDPHAAYFVVAFLEDAPGLVRGMIKSAMRSGTPRAERPHFIVTTSDEAVWKKFVHMENDKLPCVVLVDGSGNVKWSWNGEFEASQYSALKETALATIQGR